MSVRVGVTGSQGFIGRNVTAALRRRGDEVVPIQRPFVRDSLVRTFHGLNAVIHLAGVVSAVRDEEFVAGNVESTRIVAAAAEAAGVRLVHISSLAAAGPASAAAPRSEDDGPAPINTYGRTKLEGERVVRAQPRLRWTILRPGVVYGHGDRALRPLFRMATSGWLPLVGSPTAAYTFIHIDDAVRAILAAVDGDQHGDTIFLGHAPPVTTRELLDAVSTAIGVRARIVPIPKVVTYAAAVAGDLGGTVTGRPALITSRRFAELYAEGFVCRVDRMRERLGVEARVGVREGLAKAAPWYVGDE